ncbi:MAG: PH domain-containing protein [Bacteroidetes Order II. Incertae sedis bacterium]|jgi:putative membrane protein|nr:PH domain-containing protein [Bacteroidetes Order II. bacterium]MBT4051894.1 PH domain-containing protein [Bacteroidetes Order II. bacterium]MBT5249728.1 PH domain-containing protein [Bacteroidetes Order II. bacterium]MBT6200329.1 PH domain-containing protein [Bacteroidetes Order II. bacterium]MBT6424910.1 PH domain-containing protein [Bacteroidetes Order II. bacterium]
MSVQPAILKRAEFNPDVRKYWLMSGIWILFVTIAGIPLILVWYILGMWITGRYLDRLECVLTDRTLIVKKGMIVRSEKTIPLDKITDLGLVQGPLMRYFKVHSLTVETAGQSSQGALVKLYGITDVEQFRDAVLKQRDLLKSTTDEAVQPTSNPDDSLTLLREIRDTLKEIASKDK